MGTGKIQVLLSKMSVFGLPMQMAMNLAKESRFDGIEILINGWYKNHMPDYQSLAHNLGLKLHFHQAWSANEDPTDKSFLILEKIGYLPRQGYTLANHIPQEIRNEIIVVSADRINETTGDNQWLQTDCIFTNEKPILSFASFVRAVNDLHLPVVFDMLHYLEYRLGIFRDYDSLTTKKSELLKLLGEGWDILGPHTKEIHLCDFKPGERNVLPGEGVMPLQEFGEIVMNSGWSGYVVPEVSPALLFPYSTKKLKDLWGRAKVFFSN